MGDPLPGSGYCRDPTRVKISEPRYEEGIWGGVEVMASDFYQLEREFEAINEKLNGLMLERCKIWMEMERLEIPERRAATLVISRTKS